MLKVLIVDDELVIRRGLRNVVDWNLYGFDICGEASGGRDALEKVSELHPDLIIADIKMPGMDGVAMVKELRERQNTCKVIILTGYSEFEYARASIDLGVEAYLLKPIEENELIEKLISIRTGIMEERKAGIAVETAGMAIDRVMHSFIFESVGEKRLVEYSELLSLDLPWKSYQIVMISIDADSDEKSRESAEGTVREFTAVNKYGCVFGIKDIICVLLKDITFCRSNILPLTMLCRKIREEHEKEAFISAGETVGSIKDLNRAYNSALQLLNRKFICDNEKIVTFDMEQPYTDESKAAMVPDVEETAEKLFTTVDIGHEQYVNDLLEDFKECIIRSDISEKEIKAYYVNLYTCFINLLVKSNEDIVKDMIQGRNMAGEILDKHNLQKLHGFFKHMACSICSEIRIKRPDSTIKKILNYINKNYSMKLKLTSISEVFGYNCTYFGRRFKEYTGTSFNEYLDVIRIENAKRLLKEGHKVNDVAQEVGYSNKDYFYSKFKKHVGVAPTDFKKQKDTQE